MDLDSLATATKEEEEEADVVPPSDPPELEEWLAGTRPHAYDWSPVAHEPLRHSPAAFVPSSSPLRQEQDASKQAHASRPVPSTSATTLDADQPRSPNPTSPVALEEEEEEESQVVHVVPPKPRPLVIPDSDSSSMAAPSSSPARPPQSILHRPASPSESPGPTPLPDPVPSAAPQLDDAAIAAGLQQQQPERSFRHRKPNQLNPYSMEQAKYALVLQKQDWQDAIVPLKRSHELSADDIARRKEFLRTKGASDLDGWLVLEDGVRVRRDEYERQIEEADVRLAGEAEARAKKHRRRDQGQTENRDARLRRALQGYSSDDGPARAPGSSSSSSSSSSAPDDDDPRDIPRGRHTPKAKSRGIAKTSVKPRQRAQAASSVIEIQDDDDTGTLPVPQTISRPKKPSTQASSSASRAPPRKTIHIDGSSPAPSGQDSPAGDSQEEEGQDEEMDEEEKELRAVREDRFALKGRKKKFLKGMMPAVFFRKAERDLDLMRKEQRSGHHVDYGGSGDEAEAEAEEEREHERRQRRKEAKRRKRVFEDGDGQLRFDLDEDSPDEERDEDDHQDVQASWLAASAPQRHRGRRGGGGGSSFPRSAFQPLPAQPASRRQQTKDMIDRLLVQSKAAHEAQQARERKQKKRHRRQNKDRQSGVYVFEGEGPRGERRRTAMSPPSSHAQVSLADEDELWTAPTFLAPALNGSSLPAAGVNEIPRPEKRSSSGATHDGAWKKFRKFSHDFQLDRLDPGHFALSPDSELVRGNVVELLSFLNDPSQTVPMRTVFPFGIPLHGDLEPETVEGLLPKLSDSIVDAASSWVKGSSADQASQPRPADETCQALRFCALYARRAPSELLHKMQAQADHVDRRIRAQAEDEDTTTEQRASLNYFMLSVHWTLLELSLRMQAAASANQLDASLFSSPTARTRRLVKSLVDYGPNATGKALKSSRPDLSVEVWAALINVCIEGVASGSAAELEVPTEESLWEHLITELDNQSEAAKAHPVMASEALAYASIALCALSQISPAGHVKSEPRLHAQWPILGRSLESITIKDLQESLDRWSSVELSRRDGYLWTLFARTITMVDCWRWRLRDGDGILQKLYDILNARQLDNLTIDASARDFPSFLQHFNGEVDCRLESKEDSAVHMFLKLLIKVGADISAEAQDETEAKRQLNRMLVRVTPMRKLPPNSTRPMLVNHTSLFITLAIMAPWTASQRLQQLRALVPFQQADQGVRPIIIRAMMYFAHVLQHKRLPITGPLAWYANASHHLRAEYVDCDRKRIQLDAPTAKPAKGTSIITNRAERARDHKRLTSQLYHCALAMTMILRAIQNIMSVSEQLTAEAKSFPDSALVASGKDLSDLLLSFQAHLGRRTAWTSSILASPIAHDPLVGTEVIKCLQAYLDWRTSVLSQFGSAEASQDDYGFDDFDFDDPALNDLIGFQPTAGAQTNGSSWNVVKRQDTDFAKLVKNEISPALFRLITSIFTPDVASPHAAPKIQHGNLKSEYIKDLIHCWCSCADVLVQNCLKSWSSYFRFGDEACSRLAEASARREVAMLFALSLSEVDSKGFSHLFEEVSRVWLEVIVAPRIDESHLLLTKQVLSTFGQTQALLEGIEMAAPPHDVDVFSFEGLADFDNSRPLMLKAIFENASRLLQGYVPNAMATPNNQQLLALIGQMATSMRDYYRDFAPEQTVSKEAYSDFVHKVCDSLTTVSGGQKTQEIVQGSSPILPQHADSTTSVFSPVAFLRSAS